MNTYLLGYETVLLPTFLAVKKTLLADFDKKSDRNKFETNLKQIEKKS